METDGMVEIPGGEFLMGCELSRDPQCIIGDEMPIHKVRLSSFMMDRHEVTAGQFRKCVEAGGCTPAKVGGKCTYRVPGKERHPINCVDWSQAAAYCAWAGKRLPTEAEWEKAARGTDGRVHPWGDKPLARCGHAVVEGLDGMGPGCGAHGTMPVGSKPEGASPYGVMDLIGGVGEWLSDWFDEGYYDVHPAQDPGGPVAGKYRCTRGGSWKNHCRGFNLRITYRDWDLPTNWGDDIGFRCAR
jgi:formylglycine-generating enzyme required for sulfatase activity